VKHNYDGGLHEAGKMALPKIYNPYYLAFVATIGGMLWVVPNSEGGCT
jgi:hypothetical protein